MERYPLFPLNLVLLPRMPLPLHIFEERYQQMIQDCLDQNREFGVVLQTGTSVQTAGCLARIDSVINEYEDGRKDILTIGTDRFTIHKVYEDKPYLTGDIEIFGDTPPQAQDIEITAMLRDEAIASLNDFASVAGYTVELEFLESLSVEELSFLLATTDVFSMEEKQAILEMRSFHDRLRMTTGSLRESSQNRRATARIRQILGKAETDDIDYIFN